jgi:hypothetical protein
VSNPIPNVQPTYVHPGGYALNNYVAKNSEPLSADTARIEREVDVKFALNEGAVMDVKGNKLTKELLWKRLAIGTTVLVSPDGKQLDQTYAKVFKEDTLVLVPPAPKVPPPLGPPPIEKR